MNFQNQEEYLQQCFLDLFIDSKGLDKSIQTHQVKIPLG